MLFFVHASSAIPSFSSIAWDLAQIWRINLCHGPNPGFKNGMLYVFKLLVVRTSTEEVNLSRARGAGKLSSLLVEKPC
ncbi:hypothetical protein F383_03474 [Gossypium arboreum]|uniref:Uncharacterized protein n=1 Tax=Gossypium arboreum TaxID=29729 RepID=A0A0B0NIL2_GOSAR|nr:hypothetical protein F383_03474 [Gossypium arboreum]